MTDLFRHLRSLCMQGLAGEAELSEPLTNSRVIPILGKTQLVEYANLLIFLRCHACSEEQLTLIDAECARFARVCKKIFATKNSSRGVPENEGLPFQPIETSFSPACVRWLLKNPDLPCEATPLFNSKHGLAELLSLSLNPLIRTDLPADATNDELFAALKIPPRERLRFVIQQLGRTHAVPGFEEQFFHKVGARVRVFYVKHQMKFST